MRIHIDSEGATLTVEDDGEGIAYYSKLLDFAASGWDDKTTIIEKPLA